MITLINIIYTSDDLIIMYHKACSMLCTIYDHCFVQNMYLLTILSCNDVMFDNQM